MKSPSQRDICTSMVIAVLLSIAEIYKELKCPLMKELVKIFDYIYVYIHIYIYIYTHTYKEKSLKY